jgi:3D-(3,5/4)-trihydroxycyclohexane-1,2-dione acylhydrolase (decyclizing)
VIDFAKIAAGMGAEVISAGTLAEFDEALHAVKGIPGVHVIVVPVAKHKWSEGDSFWEVGVPEVSHRPDVNEARKALLEGKSQQR